LACHSVIIVQSCLHSYINMIICANIYNKREMETILRRRKYKMSLLLPRNPIIIFNFAYMKRENTNKITLTYLYII